MSQLVTQDWEGSLGYVSITGWYFSGASSRINETATAPMDGTQDAQLTTTVGGGTWNYNIGQTLGHGSARAAIIQARFKFMFENTTPVTGAQLQVINTNTQLGVHMNDGSFKLCLQGSDLSQTLGPTSLVTDTAHLIEWELRYEYDIGTYQRVWLDGVLEATHRDPTSCPAGGAHNIIQGGISGGKGTSTCRWGDMQIWLASDPS